MRYQETWVRGPSDMPFQRECARRYEPIKAFLQQYRRPFSVFDLGANMGYFSFRIAADFPQATVIAVDDKPDLAKLAAANDLRNVIVIPKRMTGADLAGLADSEAFDVVLALNVLHHMADSEQAAAHILRLGQKAIIETPEIGDCNAAHPERHAFLREMAVHLPTKEMLRTRSHVTDGGERVMTLFQTWGSKALSRQTMDVRRGGYKLLEPADFRVGMLRDAPEMAENRVTLDFDAARIEIVRPKAETVEARAFIPGMNLWNFKLLGGCRPKGVADLVMREVNRLSCRESKWMDDLRPWNFILTDGGVRAIDIGWKAWRKEPEEGGLAKCLALLAA